MKQFVTLQQIKSQDGMVLVAALVILLALTLVGVSAMGTSNLEERMSSNDRDRQIAFQAAEVALRQGEVDVEAVAGVAAHDHQHVRFERLLERFLCAQTERREAERQDENTYECHRLPQSR